MENKKVAFCDVSGIGTSRVHALVCLQGQDPVDKNFGCLWSNLALDVCLVHALVRARYSDHGDFVVWPNFGLGV